MLEFFRPDHGHEQIHEKQQRYDANNDRFHLSSLQLLAKHRVQSARQEKRDDYSYEDQVTHTCKYQRDLMRRLIKPCAKYVKKSLTRRDEYHFCASRWASNSISAVCGNMSSGVIELIANLCCNSFRSRARVGGLHDT